MLDWPKGTKHTQIGSKFVVHLTLLRSHTVIRYMMDDAGFESRYGEEFFSSPKRTDKPWSPPSLLTQWVPAFFPGGKAAGACSRQYECTSTSAHPTRLQCLDREYFRFLSALEKLRKANVRFIVPVSVRPSAQNNSAPTGRIFIKFYTFVSLGVHLSCAH
jgi:hypothetical protein